MFASLVIVYPTRHEGGALVFRHQGREFTFDSAATVREAASPSVAFAAFFSDLEHEVEVVTTGYRVTVTYNLYLTDGHSHPAPPISVTYEIALKTAFISLLADRTCLPRGGLIGFGLRHQYPLSIYQSSLQQLLAFLKGSDAVLYKVCKDLELKVSIQIVSDDGSDGQMLLPSYICLPDFETLNMRAYMVENGARVLKDAEEETSLVMDAVDSGIAQSVFRLAPAGQDGSVGMILQDETEVEDTDEDGLVEVGNGVERRSSERA